MKKEPPRGTRLRARNGNKGGRVGNGERCPPEPLRRTKQKPVCPTGARVSTKNLFHPSTKVPLSMATLTSKRVRRNHPMQERVVTDLRSLLRSCQLWSRVHGPKCGCSFCHDVRTLVTVSSLFEGALDSQLLAWGEDLDGM